MTGRKHEGIVMAKQTIRAAVIGASGYTGAELLRLLIPHPAVELVYLIAESNAGQPVHDI